MPPNISPAIATLVARYTTPAPSCAGTGADATRPNAVHNAGVLRNWVAIDAWQLRECHQIRDQKWRHVVVELEHRCNGPSPINASAPASQLAPARAVPGNSRGGLYPTLPRLEEQPRPACPTIHDHGDSLTGSASQATCNDATMWARARSFKYIDYRQYAPSAPLAGQDTLRSLHHA